MSEEHSDLEVLEYEPVCIVTNPTPTIDSPVSPREIKQRLLLERRVYPDRFAYILEVADFTTATATEMELSRDGIFELLEVLEDILRRPEWYEDFEW